MAKIYLCMCTHRQDIYKKGLGQMKKMTKNLKRNRKK